MRVDFTLRKFPSSGLVKDACGLPWSIVVQPFAKLEESSSQHVQPSSQQQQQQPLPTFDSVVRCSSCYGYINSHCHMKGRVWECSLCGKMNEVKMLWAKRYETSPSTLPELSQQVYEMIIDEVGPITTSAEGDPCGPAPVYVAMVDLCGGEEWVELVRSGLLAALEALPPYALFGLVTFSHSVGLYDVRSKVPSVRYVPIKDGHAASSLPTTLSDIMPLRALLAPVGKYKDAIATALEGLHPQAPPAPSPLPSPTSGPQRQQSMGWDAGRGGRGFGPALLGVVQYLQSLQHAPFRAPEIPSDDSGTTSSLGPAQSPAHLMVFLSGPPDFGVGRLYDNRRAPGSWQPQPGAPNGGAAGAGSAGDGVPNVATLEGAMQSVEDQWLHDVAPATVAFYQQASVAVAALGVCVDIFAASPTPVGLKVLQHLPNATGGAMYLYASVEESALPQDLYRRLSSARASAGLLRVRTSHAVRAQRFYGRVFADQQIEELHHVVCCCDSDAYAMDLDLTDKDSVADTSYIQIAFQYTAVVPVPHSSNGAGQERKEGLQGDSTQCTLQRRVRVGTYQLHPGSSPMEVMRSATSDTLLAMLMHKITKAARTQGAHSARLLLRDWLVLLASNYHRVAHQGAATRGPAALAQAPVDVSFLEADQLQALPRLVYAMLRSPLLAPAVPGQHPDLVPFLEHCWGCLPPHELARAVYPALSSWQDVENEALSRHSLSRGALMGAASGGVPPPIFLLDAYIVVIVMYTEAAVAAGLPFPPPQQSALRRAVATIRQERRITPLVRTVREGTPEADLFYHLLLDEPDAFAQEHAAGEGAAAPATSASASFGLVQFMDHIRTEVVSGLNKEAQAAAGVKA